MFWLLKSYECVFLRKKNISRKVMILSNTKKRQMDTTGAMRIIGVAAGNEISAKKNTNCRWTLVLKSWLSRMVIKCDVNLVMIINYINYSSNGGHVYYTNFPSVLHYPYMSTNPNKSMSWYSHQISLIPLFPIPLGLPFPIIYYRKLITGYLWSKWCEYRKLVYAYTTHPFCTVLWFVFSRSHIR